MFGERYLRFAYPEFYNAPPEKTEDKEEEDSEDDDEEASDKEEAPDTKQKTNSKSKTKKEKEDEDEDLDVDENSLDPKVKKYLDKQREVSAKAAEKKVKDALAVETQTKDAAARAQLLKDKKDKATKSGDLEAQLKVIEEERDDWKTKYETLEKTSHTVSDEATRRAIASDYKLPKGFHENLGSDPDKYIEQAKKLAKQMGASGKGPDLEGGNRNVLGSKANQDKSARTVASKFKF